jgi:outer membrane protein OmpA-like peptidoglycan-associated protein
MCENVFGRINLPIQISTITLRALQLKLNLLPMKLKKLLYPVVLSFVCFAASAQEDTSLANVYFAKSKFFLSAEAKDTLKAFIENHKNNHHLWVVARCDKWGGNVYNDWLSVQRAVTVKEYLVSNGFPANAIDTVKGYGKRKQLPVNGSPKEVDDKNRVATITGSYAVVQKLVETRAQVPPQLAVKQTPAATDANLDKVPPKLAVKQTPAPTDANLDKVPPKLAVKQKPAPVDTTFLTQTIYLNPPYADELRVTNKYPHKGDLLKTETDFVLRNDSPFVYKKLYVASETMDEPAPPAVAAAAPTPPAPVTTPVAAVTKPGVPDEIAENTSADDLAKQVKEHLQNGKIGESLVIRGINFDFGYHRIIKKSKPQLEAVLYALNQIPTLKLEIQGHICCWPIGQEGFDKDTKEYNLSFNRAKAVFDYLVAAGISADRLTYNGYGMKHPMVYPEKSKDDEYKNRRVEFKIVSK